MPITMLGLSALSPAARLLCCQRRLRASPPSMAASLEPVVEHPVAESVWGEFQRRLSMLTQRISSSAVCGYSSLSIMFLSKHSAMSFSACGSIDVVTNVATFNRAFPSSISSSWMISYATSGGISPAGNSWRGIVVASRPKIGATARSSPSRFGPVACVSVIRLLLGCCEYRPASAAGASPGWGDWPERLPGARSVVARREQEDRADEEAEGAERGPRIRGREVERVAGRVHDVAGDRRDAEGDATREIHDREPPRERATMPACRGVCDRPRDEEADR